MTESVTPQPIQEPVSVDDNAGSLTVDNATLSVVGGGVEATALRVTLASDSTGLISVDDNGGSLTVDNGGTFVVQDSEKLVDNAAFTDGTTKVMPTGYVFDAVAGVALTENDIAAARIDSKRAQVAVIEDPTTRGRYAAVTAGLQLATVVGDVATFGDAESNIGIKLWDAGATTRNLSGYPFAFNGTTWDRQRNGGGTEALALRVTLANDSTGLISVDDNGGSLTVDGTVTVSGGAAHASPVVGNPNLVAGRASTAVPVDVGADGDAASLWTNRFGAPVVTMAPHVGLNTSPWDLVHETAQYTTTQTSAVLVAGGVSEKLVVTKVQIQVGGTTAGTLQLYFGTAAYTRGTSRAIFDGEFAPSATLKPGVIMDGPFISGTNGDDLLVTTSAAINPLTITVWYYVVT